MALGLVILCIILSILANVNTGKNEYDVVFLGDSIVAGIYGSGYDIPSLVESDTGMTTLNGAFGGTSLATIPSEKLVGDLRNQFLMYRLSDSIACHDFSLQIISSQNENNAKTPYWYETATELDRVKWNNVKYILIEHGANDYLNGIQIENSENQYDNDTFKGALRYSIENVQKGAPNAQIILVTPIYMNPAGLEGDCYEVDYGGGYLEDYVEAVIAVASEYGLTVIDDFHEVDINKDNYEEYIPGGLHGNLEGNTLIADNISKHLKELDGLD